MNVKKWISRLLVATMAVSMMVGTLTAFAEEEEASTGSVVLTNIPSDTGMSIADAEYAYYRIFDATVLSDSDGDVHVEYTVNSKFVDFFAAKLNTTSEDVAFDALALQYVRSFADINDLVTELLEYVYDSTNEKLVTPNISSVYASSENSETSTTSNLQYGYYLILDTHSGNANTAITTAGILMTLTEASETVTLKGSLPSITKEIYHNDEETWESVADHQIGDTVSFVIEATLPTDLTGYDLTEDGDSDTLPDYTYWIFNKSSAGVTYDSTSVKIYTTDPRTGQEGGALDASAVELDEGYYSKVESSSAGVADELDTIFAGTELKYSDFDFIYAIEVDDIFKFYADTDDDGVTTYPDMPTTIYIAYTGTLNENAVVSSDYEQNTVALQYSNNPYATTASYGYDSETVYAYTFDLDVTKVGEDGSTPLAGAVFALYIGDVQVPLTKDTSVTTGTPVYYTDADSTAKIPDSAPATYVEATHGVIITADAEGDNDEDGKFIIKGLDDSVTYILKEVEAPEGYNAISPLEIVITATYDDFDMIEELTVGDTTHFSADVDGLSTTVINTSTSQLPETGGMGTTAFPIVGGGMMAAALFVILRKRKS